MSIENSADTYTNLRIMNWIEIIDNAFHLYRKQFLLFIGISLIFFIVGSVEDKLLDFVWKNNPYRLVEKLISYLLTELVTVIFVIATSEIYFQRHITLKDTFQHFKNIHPRYLFSVFIYLIPSALPSFLIIVMVATVSFFSSTIILSLYLLIFIVCTYFQITWQMYAPVIVVEGRTKTKPLSRSRHHSSGKRPHALAWGGMSALIFP